MLKLAKSLPLLVLLCSITGNLLAAAEGLDIYRPNNYQEEGIQDITDDGVPAADEGISPVNYPAMTPASSLMEEPSRQRQDGLFPRIYQRNQSQPDLVQPSDPIKPAKKISSVYKLKLSSPPPPLSPDAAPELSPIAWKRSELPAPRLKVKTVEPLSDNKPVTGEKESKTDSRHPQLDAIKTEAEPFPEDSGKLALQPVSSLPAVASAGLQPMMLGPQDMPALRDVDNASVRAIPQTVTPTVTTPVFVNAENPNARNKDAAASENADKAADKKATKPKAEKPPRPVVYYTPLPAIAVFPVIKQGTNIIFSDVPVVFAKELSRRLELQAPGTRILNPYYTVEAMKAKGIDHLYQKLMKEYRYAGRPDPITLDYMLKRLSENSDRPVARVFFVEADLDTNEPMSPKGPGGVVDRIRNAFDGSTPDYMKYYVRSHIQAYDTEDPDMPQVWNFDWKYPVRAERFNNVTASVFDDSDALRAFSETSGMLGKAALLILPKSAYMEEHVDTSVQGHLANQGNGQEVPQTQLEPGMHPIGTASPESNENGEANLALRSRSGKPKRPVTESARQVIDRMNRWLY